MQLTLEQKQEGRRVLNLISDPAIPAVKLSGRAGTGKTTLLEFIIERLSGRKIICAAPTNMAVDVLRNKLDHLDRLEFSTVASLLKARKVNDYETGQVRFETTDEVDEKKKIIIVDEASMLDKATKDKLLKVFPNCKFIFVGDPGQLPPPVDGPRYCVLDELPGGHLTENHRCGKGNALFDFIERVYEGDLSMPDHIPGKIEHIKRSDIILDDLNIAFHNKTVDAVNKMVFDEHWKGTLQPGVKLVACETFTVPNYSGKVYNGEIMYVTRVADDMMPMSHVGYQLIYDAAKDLGISEIKQYRVNTQYYKFTMTDDPAYYKLRDKLAKEQQWKAWFQLGAMFKDVRLAYGITCHRVQGMTLPQASLVWNDLINASPEMAQPLVYVAASRATDKIKILTK